MKKIIQWRTFMPTMQVGHAYHAGRRALVSTSGEVLAGRLEPRALQFVREWAKLRQDEILANWERARRNEPLHGIEPLS
jgi:Domain of unknown function (DUF4160)